MSEKSKSVGDEWLDVEADAPEAGESENKPADDYKVGPGRPPRETQWKKNGPSPNPRGRPRNEQSMAPDLKKAFTTALNRKIRVSRGEKEILMTRVQAGIEQLLNQFAKGDHRARKDLMALADKLGIDFLAKERQAIEDALAPNLQAILDAYVARVSNSGNVAPTTPVLAPPELLDDDGADPAGGAPTGPQAGTEPTLVAPVAAKNAVEPAPRSPLPTKYEAAPMPSPQQGTSDRFPLPSSLPATVVARPPISAASPSRSVTGVTAPPPKARPAARPAPAAVKAQTVPSSPPPPDPEPEPGKIYPKPFSRMRWTEKRAWYRRATTSPVSSYCSAKKSSSLWRSFVTAYVSMISGAKSWKSNGVSGAERF